MLVVILYQRVLNEPHILGWPIHYTKMHDMTTLQQYFVLHECSDGPQKRLD